MDSITLFLCVPVKGAKDKYGNPNKGYKERAVFAEKSDVYRSEFYQASRAGYHAETTYSVARIDYNGEKVVREGDSYFVVIRTAGNSDSDYLTLVCGGRINDKEY